MTPALHLHQTAEARHRGRAFAQDQALADGAVELLDALHHPLGVMLQGEAVDCACLLLQCPDRQAVIEAVLEIITAAGGAQIVPEAEGELEPLAQLALEEVCGPEPGTPLLAQIEEVRP